MDRWQRDPPAWAQVYTQVWPLACRGSGETAQRRAIRWWLQTGCGNVGSTPAGKKAAAQVPRRSKPLDTREW